AVQMAQPSVRHDLRKSVYEAYVLVVQPCRGSEIGSDVEPGIRDLDGHMRERCKYGFGSGQRTALLEPLVNDREVVLDPGRMAGVALNEPAQRGTALCMPGEIDERDTGFGWHRAPVAESPGHCFP